LSESQQTAFGEKMIAAKDGAVGWMIFNNPKRHNALSFDMWEAIPSILDQFEADAEIRVIVLKGAGEKSFISGADISEFDKKRASAEAVAEYDHVAHEASERLSHAAKPTVAMIRGYCIGGGLGVALSCDMRIASQGSRFAIPAAKLGLGYRVSSLQPLVALIGPAYAKEIIITAGGKNLSPEKIENVLKLSPYIKEAIAVGDARKFISALIQIDGESVGDWASRLEITYTSYEDLTAKKEVHALIEKAVTAANERLARVENVRAFRILPKELHEDDGELTATQKVRRSAVHAAYSHLTNQIYGDS